MLLQFDRREFRDKGLGLQKTNIKDGCVIESDEIFKLAKYMGFPR